MVVTASVRLRERTQIRKGTKASTFLAFASRPKPKDTTGTRDTAAVTTVALDDLSSKDSSRQSKPEYMPDTSTSIFDFSTVKGSIHDPRTRHSFDAV